MQALTAQKTFKYRENALAHVVQNSKKKVLELIDEARLLMRIKNGEFPISKEVRDMIQADVTLFLPGRKRTTVLIYAVRRRLSDLVDLLINSASVARRDADEKSPLDHAVQINDFPLCIRLVEEGDVSRDLSQYIAPRFLTMAAQAGRADIVQKLIAAGFNFSDEVECRGGALIGAVSTSQREVLELLFAAGIVPNKEKSFHLLLIAYNKDNTAIFEWLLEQGISTEISDYHGETLLLRAAERYPGKFCDILLRHNANLYVEDEKGNTPLMRAVQSRNDASVKDLLKACSFVRRSSYINHANHSGKTALMYAAENNAEKSLELLLEFGADISLVDTAGRTWLTILSPILRLAFFFINGLKSESLLSL